MAGVEGGRIFSEELVARYDWKLLLYLPPTVYKVFSLEDPGKDEENIGIAVDLLRRVTSSKRALEYRNHFHEWVEKGLQEVELDVKDFYNTARANSGNLDASRGLGSSTVALYRAPAVRLPTLWLMEIVIPEWAKYGDGNVAKADSGNFESIQKKGIHEHNSQLLIRQRR